MYYSEKSKRRTKTVAGTLEPKWNQTFVYVPMKRAEIRAQSLQITVYDYDRIGSGEYVGEVGQWAIVSPFLLYLYRPERLLFAFKLFGQNSEV